MTNDLVLNNTDLFIYYAYEYNMTNIDLKVIQCTMNGDNGVG